MPYKGSTIKILGSNWNNSGRFGYTLSKTVLMRTALSYLRGTAQLRRPMCAFLSQGETLKRFTNTQRGRAAQTFMSSIPHVISLLIAG